MGAGADIYMILAVIFPKITKKGGISIQFDGQVTHYLHGSSQGTQIGKQFPGPACIVAVPGNFKGV
jgi:hypothetical protein